MRLSRAKVYINTNSTKENPINFEKAGFRESFRESGNIVLLGFLVQISAFHAD